MVEEIKYNIVGDLIKLFLKESLQQQKNEMMNNFSQTLQWIPTIDASSSNSHIRSTVPFKVQVNFDITIYKFQINENFVDKWLNQLEGYFSIHSFFDRENITFSLLKVVPRVKEWWETFCEKMTEEPSLFIVTLS